MQVARHLLGVGGKAHRAWVSANGLSFTDLLMEQATMAGNKGYAALARIIEEAQDKV